MGARQESASHCRQRPGHTGFGGHRLAISGAVLLVLTFVEIGWVVPVLTAFLVGVFGILWFVIPIRERSLARRGERKHF